ncbi:hypothetical protein RJ55_04837 [Drechmeria coniospora]|nr:hypothetical protein RJ55_04837 [Drechmeria coniospora]
MRNNIFAAIGLLLAGAGALAVGSDEACAKVSDLWISHIDSHKPGSPKVPAALAYQCLNSVPLDRTAALDLVYSLEPYLQFQSDAAYKADPPTGYPFPAYDLFANLAKVKQNLKDRKYTSEYTFQVDLLETVFMPGHDSHFQFIPDLLFNAVAWSRTDVLASVSEDGLSLPAIKRYDDVRKNPETAPVIAAINGIDAATFMESIAARGTEWTDIDAGYNSMFFDRSTYSKTAQVGNFVSGYNYIGLLYPGATTTYTYANNGTPVTVDNLAVLQGDWRTLRNGTAVFNMFCAPKGSSTPIPQPTHPYIFDVPSMAAAAKGHFFTYPEPKMATSDLVVSGYYLEDSGLENTAVLALAAFASNSTAEFQSVCRTFLEMAAGAGKTKLVIDLQSNVGGLFVQFIDLLHQIIPDIEEDYYFRGKMSEEAIALARSTGERLANITDPLASTDTTVAWDSSLWYTDYRFGVDVQNRPFKTFEDKFSSQTFKGTNYTSLYRWDLNNSMITTNKEYGVGMEVTGYGKLAIVGLPRFKPENIVIVHDGICNSACAYFSEHLSRYGVKTIAIGGRPKVGPMQGTGGGKGGPLIPYQSLYNAVQRAKKATTDPLRLAVLNRFSDTPIRRSVVATVTSADWIQARHVQDGIPTQFTTNHADCRLFWTAPMLKNGSEVWKAAANVAFHNAKCAYGGMNNKKPLTQDQDS